MAVKGSKNASLLFFLSCLFFIWFSRIGVQGVYFPVTECPGYTYGLTLTEPVSGHNFYSDGFDYRWAYNVTASITIDEYGALNPDGEEFDCGDLVKEHRWAVWASYAKGREQHALRERILSHCYLQQTVYGRSSYVFTITTPSIDDPQDVEFYIENQEGDLLACATFQLSMSVEEKTARR